MRATVFASTDRIEAQAVLGLLRSGGLDAELVGVVDAARLGVGEGALPLRIEVAAEDEARAKELLAARPEPVEAEGDEAPARPRKVPLIALGVPVVWPGLGHVYAGRPVTGVVLMLAVLGSFLAAMVEDSAVLTYFVLLVLDALFGRRAVLAFNEGRQVSSGRQLAAGVAMVLGAAALVGVRFVLGVGDVPVR